MRNLKEFINENNLLIPNYNEINIVDLMKCLYAKCGYSVESSSKINELDSMIPNNKHYLFILSDGTGMNLINKLDNDSIIKQNLKQSIITVFPSTTGCVLTSVVTALYPEEHGIWGWFNYNRELNRDYFPVLFSDRKSGKNLKDFGVKSDDIFKNDSILKNLNVKTDILFPAYICDSVYSEFVSHDSNRHPYNDFSDIERIVKDICESDDLSYTYLYIPDVDSIEHKNGVYSEVTLNKLKEIDNLVKSISKNKNLTIVFTADHGQTNISEDIVLDFNKYKKFFYAYPSIDFGTASYYVKKEYEEEFIREFELDFKNKMFLFKTQDFIDNKMFGPLNISDYAASNLGEYISLCKTGSYLINSPDTDSYFGKIKGNHSGLTKDEMLIPLVIIDTNLL